MANYGSFAESPHGSCLFGGAFAYQEITTERSPASGSIVARPVILTWGGTGDFQIQIATDEYDGPEQFIAAPEGFTVEDLEKYMFVEGELVVVVPKSITRRQAKQLMFSMGLLIQIDPMIEAIENETDKMMMKIFWEDSQEFERYHPQFIAMAYQLGLSDEQIDSAFIQAAQL